jgi:hypothetical protein
LFLLSQPDPALVNAQAKGKNLHCDKIIFGAGLSFGQHGFAPKASSLIQANKKRQIAGWKNIFLPKESQCEPLAFGSDRHLVQVRF